MKVCFINNLYGTDAKGGAEKVVAVEAERLAAKGHEVLVVSVGRERQVESGACSPDGGCFSTSATSIQERKIVPCNLYLYGDGKKHHWPAKVFWHLIDTVSMSGPNQVMRIVRDFSPDLVHTHNLMGVGFRLPRLLRKEGHRHIHTVHDVQLINPSGLIPAWGSRALAIWAEQVHGRILAIVFGSPEIVIFPSEFMQKFHAKFGFFKDSSQKILRNPAPEPSDEKRTILAGAPVKFLFVGQLEVHKGVRLLVEAWRKAELEDAVLEIVGRGGLENEVRKAAEDGSTIVYRGRLTGAALTEAYRSATYCVVPSLVMENAPTVISESFAAGTPVVALASGGMPELVHDGETGILVPFAKSGVNAPSQRSAVLASFISSLRSAASERSDVWRLMSENGRQFVRRQTAEKHADALLEIYEGK